MMTGVHGNEPGSWRERGLGEDKEVELYSEDELDDRDVFRPKEVSLDDLRTVYLFLRAIKNRYTYHVLLDRLKETMNTPTKLQYLVNRMYSEATKFTYSSDSHILTRFAKMCSQCCSVTWICEKGRNKTFEEFLVDRVSKEFHSASILRQRINYVLKDYKGPEHKKEQWSNLKMREFLPSMFDPKCISFVHALFLELILVPGDIHLYIEKLLEIPDERSLDILNDLLTELGEDLEFRPHLGRIEQVADDRLNPYFLKVQQIAYSPDSDISEELREKLLTLVNLRKRSWLKDRY